MYTQILLQVYLLHRLAIERSLSVIPVFIYFVYFFQYEYNAKKKQLLACVNFLLCFRLTFARASRDASASAAIARCICTGKRTSLISTRSTLTPQESVASSRLSCIMCEIDSRSERICDRSFVPSTLRSVVAASSLVERP